MKINEFCVCTVNALGIEHWQYYSWKKWRGIANATKLTWIKEQNIVFYDNEGQVIPINQAIKWLLEHPSDDS